MVRRRPRGVDTHPKRSGNKGLRSGAHLGGAAGDNIVFLKSAPSETQTTRSSAENFVDVAVVEKYTEDEARIESKTKNTGG